MPEKHPDQQPLLGLNLVFEAGQRKIREQLKTVESLDVKRGVLVGFLGALVAGLLAAILAAEPNKVHLLLGRPAGLGWIILVLLALDAVLIAVALITSFNAYRPREFNSGIRFEALFGFANVDPREIKLTFLRTLNESVRHNHLLLGAKQASAQKAAWFALGVLIGLLITTAVIVLRLKL